MPNILYAGQTYTCEGQSVLDCLTAQGISIPSSCRAGSCQTCLMCAVSGTLPELSQRGLKPTLVVQHYFKACSCYPETDLEVQLPNTALGKFDAQVVSLDALNDEIIGVRLRPISPFPYQAGQFINLYQNDSTARCYSLASVPSIDDTLHLHVRRVPNGVVSNWIADQLKVGDTVAISAASGDCFYVAGQAAPNMLLIGTGSGLAPLYGIVRDALQQGHQGDISLYHGSTQVSGLYLVEALRNLAQAHPNFHYTPCVSDETPPADYRHGMVLDVVLKDLPDLKGYRVFLCGNPNMVKAAQQEAFFAGASLRDIFADPF
ncbi:MAG: FAD-binding oxidoreductase [Gallionella sp.]|nr:FAD-binding oxidoreductase [Gallionella sp.]